MKRLVILGSTGSIGTNALKVVEAFPGRFKVVGLAARGDDALLADQALRFRPARVAIDDARAAARLRQRLAGSGVEVCVGAEGVAGLARREDTDLVLAAIAGGAGLVPTWRALSAGIDVAVANKEPLVMAGALVTAEARRTGATLLPVDSEHHALAQALRGLPREAVAAVTLTASGGPFLDTPAGELERVTVEQALRHPRWTMGSKITIDSATLMNKGLEVIEAYWLFGIPEELIRVTVHPESIVHGMVHLSDGGVLAYLSNPDMRIPIAAALNHPATLDGGLPPLDLETAGRLTFRAHDPERFPSLDLARRSLRLGGTAPAVLNGANEEAVAAFLRGEIVFTAIPRLVADALANAPPGTAGGIEEVLAADRLARERVRTALSSGTFARPAASNTSPRHTTAGAPASRRRAVHQEGEQA